MDINHLSRHFLPYLTSVGRPHPLVIPPVPHSSALSVRLKALCFVGRTTAVPPTSSNFYSPQSM